MESMVGGSEESHGFNNWDTDWDTVTNKNIKCMDKMFKRNGRKR